MPHLPAAVTGFVQKRIANPVLRQLPVQTLLETTGRKSGAARRTPLGGKLVGDQFWLVSEFGEQSQYIRNIKADPRVRIRVRGKWHSGTGTSAARRRPTCAGVRRNC